MSRPSIGKVQREKDRRARAAAKAERRAQRSTDEVPAAPPGPSAEEEADLLDELARLHARFDEGDIDFESFAAAKERITERLRVG